MDDAQLTARLKDFYQARDVDVDALIERSRQRRRTISRYAWSAAIAVSFALVMIATRFYGPQEVPQIYATTLAQELIDLQDGSVAALNVGSRLRVGYSRDARDLYLDNGQGLFRVRHDDKRPFRVHTATAVVEALGTEFDVRAASDQTIVAVSEGVVTVSAGSTTMHAGQEKTSFGEPFRVAAGQSVTLWPGGRTEQVSSSDVAAVMAWREPAERLEFKNQPLAAIADTFNRYNAAPKLRIEGDELRKRPFDILVFINANPQSLLNYLAQDGSLEFVHRDDDIVIRERDED